MHPSKIDFGNIQVLQDATRILNLSNQAVIPASFWAEMVSALWGCFPAKCRWSVAACDLVLYTAFPCHHLKEKGKYSMIMQQKGFWLCEVLAGDFLGKWRICIDMSRRESGSFPQILFIVWKSTGSASWDAWGAEFPSWGFYSCLTPVSVPRWMNVKWGIPRAFCLDPQWKFVFGCNQPNTLGWVVLIYKW